MALRADGAEALNALDRARAQLEDVGGSIDDILGGSLTVTVAPGPEPRPGQGVPARRTLGTEAAEVSDPLRHAMYASRIVAQLRHENQRLNELLDQASRYIAELESEITRARRSNHGDAG
ncbi:hypothetical protein [Roseospira navarrensis]|uniref:Uncharacterized protein n=1 Tax=Roseospira navarrensis TaxID=140058 RepID=A0A7X1ZCA5_9PROT|nr:hypothetical protein [Roseospira navarrensis]MQX35915.1 hypothetical protein [Roseospira navarrensis]